MSTGIKPVMYQHEVIVPDEGLPFKLFLFEGANGNYIRKKHWHSSIELFGVASGTIDVILNEKTCHLNAGEFLIINSNEVHSIHAPNPNKTIVLQMETELFTNYYTHDQFIWFSHKNKEADEDVMRALIEMYGLLEERKTGYEFLMVSKFARLEYDLVTHYLDRDPDEELLKNNRNLRKLSVITKYIKQHYREELSLDKLAEIFGYSSVYLSRMFVKYAKINYKDYVQSVRLEHAEKQLTGTEKPIGDIAVSCGFPNSKAFSNLFRKRYNILPNEYRKQVKNQHKKN